MIAPERIQAVRRGVLVVSTVLGLIGLFWIAKSFSVDGRIRFGNPVVGTLPSANDFDPQPRQVRAEVTRVRGNPVVSAGDKCEFLVERRARENESFYCNAQVVCGGRLLYGGPERGYFPCKLFEDDRPDIVGSDPSPTSADQDGAIQINTREGIMRIWDDAQGPLGAFEVEAEVLSVQ